ncbi:MAG: hypothetical protein R2834_07755 [Rhodothermales bacterium]
MDDIRVSSDRYNRIASQIGSEESVVGIDAKKTHIYILSLLLDMRDQLARLEARIDALEKA